MEINKEEEDVQIDTEVEIVEVLDAVGLFREQVERHKRDHVQPNLERYITYPQQAVLLTTGDILVQELEWLRTVVKVNTSTAEAFAPFGTSAKRVLDTCIKSLHDEVNGKVSYPKLSFDLDWVIKHFKTLCSKEIPVRLMVDEFYGEFSLFVEYPINDFKVRLLDFANNVKDRTIVSIEKPLRGERCEFPFTIREKEKRSFISGGQTHVHSSLLWKTEDKHDVPLKYVVQHAYSKEISELFDKWVPNITLHHYFANNLYTPHYLRDTWVTFEISRDDFWAQALRYTVDRDLSTNFSHSVTTFLVIYLILSSHTPKGAEDRAAYIEANVFESLRNNGAENYRDFFWMVIYGGLVDPTSGTWRNAVGRFPQFAREAIVAEYGSTRAIWALEKPSITKHAWWAIALTLIGSAVAASFGSIAAICFYVPSLVATGCALFWQPFVTWIMASRFAPYFDELDKRVPSLSLFLRRFTDFISIPFIIVMLSFAGSTTFVMWFSKAKTKKEAFKPNTALNITWIAGFGLTALGLVVNAEKALKLTQSVMSVSQSILMISNFSNDTNVRDDAWFIKEFVLAGGEESIPSAKALYNGSRKVAKINPEKPHALACGCVEGETFHNYGFCATNAPITFVAAHCPFRLAFECEMDNDAFNRVIRDEQLDFLTMARVYVRKNWPLLMVAAVFGVAIGLVIWQAFFAVDKRQRKALAPYEKLKQFYDGATSEKIKAIIKENIEVRNSDEVLEMVLKQQEEEDKAQVIASIIEPPKTITQKVKEVVYGKEAVQLHKSVHLAKVDGDKCLGHVMTSHTDVTKEDRYQKLFARLSKMKKKETGEWDGVNWADAEFDDDEVGLLKDIGDIYANLSSDVRFQYEFSKEERDPLAQYKRDGLTSYDRKKPGVPIRKVKETDPELVPIRQVLAEQKKTALDTALTREQIQKEKTEKRKEKKKAAKEKKKEAGKLKTVTAIKQARLVRQNNANFKPRNVPEGGKVEVVKKWEDDIAKESSVSAHPSLALTHAKRTFLIYTSEKATSAVGLVSFIKPGVLKMAHHMLELLGIKKGVYSRCWLANVLTEDERKVIQCKSLLEMGDANIDLALVEVKGYNGPVISRVVDASATTVYSVGLINYNAQSHTVGFSTGVAQGSNHWCSTFNGSCATDIVDVETNRSLGWHHTGRDNVNQFTPWSVVVKEVDAVLNRPLNDQSPQ